MERRIYSDVMASGLWSTKDDEPYFSREGCDSPDCESADLAADVYDCKGYRSLEEAQNGNDNYYEFRLCGECLCREANGEG
jgi:hypothetical protein